MILRAIISSELNSLPSYDTKPGLREEKWSPMGEWHVISCNII